MSTHYVTKCRKHGKIVSQCRCPGPNKAVRWVEECDHEDAVEAAPPSAVPTPFQTYERLERSVRVQVTEDNIGSVARALGWMVDYADAEKGPKLVKPGGSAHPTLVVGDWVDEEGKRVWPAGYGTDWVPEGTYRRVAASEEPLRPTVTEADVEKAARAARAAYLGGGAGPWDAVHQGIRDDWMKTARAAIVALDIEEATP